MKHFSINKAVLIRFVFALLIVAISLVGIACSTKTDKTTQDKDAQKEPSIELADQQIVRVGFLFPYTTTLDPHVAGSVVDQAIVRSIHSGLVRLAPGSIDTKNILPDLAKSWELSDDKRVWTFYLEQGVQWQKGFGEFTTEDVKFSIERVKDPATGSPTRTDFSTIEQVDIVDKYTIKITTSKPDPILLLKMIDFRGGLIVSKKAVQQYGDDFKANPIGTGPYQMKENIYGEKVVLERNPNFYRKQPTVETIEMLLIPDANARDSALLTGQIDIAAARTDYKNWTQRMRDNGLTIDILKPGVAGLLFMNINTPPFNDIRVRQAMIHAINPEPYLEGAYGDTATRLESIIPPGYFGYTTEGVKKYEYDPEKAKELLKEAGYPNGFTVEQFMTSNPIHYDPNVYMQGELKKAGINMKLTMLDHSAWIQKASSGGNKPLTWFVISQTDPDLAVSPYLDSEGVYSGIIGATGYDELVREARYEFDLEKRKEIYTKVQRKFMDEALAVPLRVEYMVIARWPYIDLGYEPQGTFSFHYKFDENLRVLKH